MQNEKCKMQNYGMGQGPYISIHKIIFEENTFILHSAFCILHFERQLGKLQFTALRCCVGSIFVPVIVNPAALWYNGP